jgi:FkbM family methyltransferase
MTLPSSSVADSVVGRALSSAGHNARFREAIFSALREAETLSPDPVAYRNNVRWPLVQAVLADAKFHQVFLADGLVFEVSLASRIEQSLLLSADDRPSHVWEPQTTRLLQALSSDAEHVIVGGAYIGDHVLPIASMLAARVPQGTVHAFEPMEYAYARLQRNAELNRAENVRLWKLALWDRSGAVLTLDGPDALAAATESNGTEERSGENVQAVSVDDYVCRENIASVRLLMLDLEGGEERALRGARQLLSRTGSSAPHVVFEVHRQYVDWTDGLESTSIVNLLTSLGYSVYAIRDLHDNYSMANRPIEIIPIDRVYLEGPPHGFNLLATKEHDLVPRLSLSVVVDVSPKLLFDKDPMLHHPRDGMPFSNRSQPRAEGGRTI